MKSRDFFYIAIIIILSGLFFHTCNRNKDIKVESENISEFLKDSIQYYKNEHNQEVAYKKALQGEKISLEVLLSKQIDSTGQLKILVNKYKNIVAAGNIITITRIDSIPVPYDVPVPFEFERIWKKTDTYYSLSGKSNQNGITIDYLEIPNTISFAIGDKKTGLFKSEFRIEAVNSNPYVKTTGLDAFSHKTNDGIISIGGQVGFGYTLYGASPYAGVGVNFDLWEILKSIFK